ncbi:glycoside hydrolase family 127 protein [Desertivirga arenae]|uniref:glycoside hydrolase family 127 protein n=1 Tax=Desertivirga arenae TaxID=2810309 RepID=UPI001A97CF6C|nr:beta-L-arabinofuranosidase domain-containing protein [Pedobacter sp. SYSU D00823]
MKKSTLIKATLALIFSGALVPSYAQQKDYPFHAVNFTSVKFTDNFWLPRLRINHTATIPASFERCENTGRVKNFEMAASRSGKFCTTFPFDDTDIYKTIEGASFSLSLFPDKKLESYIDGLITKVANAQEPDGYLYTARTIDPSHPHAWAGLQRWEKERELSHELYNSGHLYEAAAAHYYATGKKNLLNIALKNADLVCSVFGEGKKHVAPGHEIVEMGLVKLYRITGKKEYLVTAKDFIDERGRYAKYDKSSSDPWKNGAYWQDNKPVTEQKEAIGHAVRAAYLYSGVADVAALTGNKAYLEAVDSIWENTVSKKMYVQGGIGAVPSGERFGDNYELPNTTAYNETCAAIANVYWNHRMFLLHGDSKYMDILEKSLYNGLISGVALDGKSFFYSNAMQIKHSFSHSAMEPERAGWFECSCCPTNMTRLLPSIPGYVYAQKDQDVYVNLFVKSNATLNVKGNSVSIEQQNNYPWQGALRFIISPKSSSSFGMKIRIPGWARNEAMPSDLYRFTNNVPSKVEIRVNGKSQDYKIEKGYAYINRTWKKGDVIDVNLPMDVQKVVANEKVKEDMGKVALQRGPLVYCAEWVDNNGKASNMLVPAEAAFQTEFRPDLLNGVIIIKAKVPVIEIDAKGQNVTTVQKDLTAIPYYSWANRGKGEMLIWFPQQIKDLDVITADVGDKSVRK